MRDRLAEFGDAVVVVIAFSAPEYVVAYQRQRMAPLTVLIDEERVAYRAYGLGRGPVWKVWGPRVWWAYLRLIRRGRRFQRPIEDTLQLGGDFVVGRDGRLMYGFRSADPDDRPSVDDLTAALRRAGSSAPTSAGGRIRSTSLPSGLKRTTVGMDGNEMGTCRVPSRVTHHGKEGRYD